MIFNDGLENVSKRFSRSNISERISRQRNEHGWEFIFLAASQDAIAAASLLSMEHAAGR